MAVSTHLVEFKTYIEADAADTSNDDLINLVLNGAENFIETWCNIKLSTTTITETLSSLVDSSIRVSKSPVASVVSLSINGVTQDISNVFISGSYLEAVDFSFPKTNYGVVVEYTYGYSTLPSDLLLALYKLAEFQYKAASENRDGMVTYGTNNSIDEKYAQIDLPPTVEQTLLRYKTYSL